MLALYFSPGACSLAAHIALKEAGAAFELRRVDFAAGGQRSPEYLAVNPHGRVPALATPDGTIVESVAILDWIARAYPAAHLLPEAPFARAQAMSILVWLSGTVHGTGFAGVFRPARFAGDEAAQAAIKADSLERVKQHLAEIDRRLAGRDWFGERFSLPDLYVLVFRRWAARLGMDLGAFPHLVATADRVAARPAAAKALAAEGIKGDA